MDTPQPISVSAMVICDGVATDNVTGRATIINTTRGFSLGGDSESLNFAVYLALSDVTRKVRLDIQLVSSDDEIIYELPPFVVEAKDPFTTVEFDARFTGVEIQKA